MKEINFISKDGYRCFWVKSQAKHLEAWYELVWRKSEFIIKGRG